MKMRSSVFAIAAIIGSETAAAVAIASSTAPVLASTVPSTSYVSVTKAVDGRCIGYSFYFSDITLINSCNSCRIGQLTQDGNLVRIRVPALQTAKYTNTGSIVDTNFPDLPC